MSLDFLPSYRLEKSKERRSSTRPDYIIINHSYDFLKTSVYFSPHLIYDDYKLQHPEFIKLAKDEYNYDSDFSHDYIELIGKHYVRIHSVSYRQYSPFINELVDKELVPPQYKNCLLVTLLGNYNQTAGDIIEKEIYNALGYHLAELTHIFNVSKNKIIFLEDIFDFDANSKLDIKSEYNVSKTRLDFNILNLFITKYK